MICKAKIIYTLYIHEYDVQTKAILGTGMLIIYN